MKMKRFIIAVLLMALLLPSFSGCSRKQELAAAPALSATEWTGEGGCYKKAPIVCNGEAIGVWGSGNSEYIGSFSLDGSGKATFEITDGRGGSIYESNCDNLLAFTGSGDVLWTAETEPDSKLGQALVLKKLSTGGAVTKTVMLNDIAPVSAYVEDMAADAQNNLFIIAGGALFAVDEGGKLLTELTFSGAFPVQLAVNSLGEVCALAQTAEGKVLYSLDVKTGKTEKLTELGEYDIHNGSGSFYLYLTNSKGLWVMSSPEAEKLEPVIVWAECSMDFAGLSSVFPISGGRFLCVDDNGAYVVSPATPDEIVHKTVLTLACVSPKEIDKIVSKFNVNNERYTVVVDDYSQGGAVSRSDALNRLNTEIIGGNIPDMILFSDMSMSPYTQKGLMADLYGFMDDDPDLDRSDYIMLDKFETGGALYYVANLSYVELVYGRYADFGDSWGWTIDKFMELQDSMKNGESVFPDMSRNTFLEYLVRAYLRNAVDWESGTCNFENEGFISLLNAAKSLDSSAETDYGLFFMQTADELGRGERITSLGTLYNVCAVAETEKLAGEKLSIIGWPTVDGGCGTMLELQYPIGICEKSGNKEGAWAFAKYVLDLGTACIPINKEKLNEAFEGCIVRTGRLKDFPPLMTWEDADRLLEFLEQIEVVDEANDDIMNIILEEAGSYFAGVRSAEEAAKLINSRVGILLAERS